MQNFQMLKIEADVNLEDQQGLITPGLFQQIMCGEGTFDHSSIFLKVGKIQLPLKIFLDTKVRKEALNLRLCPQDMKRLNLQSRRYGFVWEESTRQLRLGPVVGVMSEMQKNVLRPFRKQTLFFKQLLEEAEKCGILAYIFPPSAFQEGKKGLKGYIFRKNQWITDIFPFPDVVYPRHSGYSTYALNIRKKIQMEGAVFINPPLIGKWKTTCWLNQYEDMRQYLPETYKISDFYQIEEMLEKWGAVFLKPITGSQGKNIIRVENGKQEYYFQYQIKEKKYRGRARNLGELKAKLQKIMQDQPFIVQQQIDLLRVNQCVADVRVVVQKNQYNQWQVTGKAFRIGHRGSITSNISAGGYAQSVSKILNDLFPSLRARNIEEKIDEVSLMAARYLEEGIGPTGEFGVDIGVDKNGEIWFIEANLKPGRQVFVLLGDLDGRKRSLRGPLLYARWLAGFEKNIEQGEDEDGKS